MGFMYYAEYLHLFERARSAYIRQCGILLPVREANCRYRSPARYDDLLLVRIAIAEWGRASLRFVYEITSSDKKKILASGMTQHALIDRSGHPQAIPAWFKDVIGKLRQPEEGEALY